MPILNASSPSGPVSPAILHPKSMRVSEAWGVVKNGGSGAEAFNYQAQLVVTPRGTWVCCWTQGGHESTGDQHVVVARSEDAGRTWGHEIMVEAAGDSYHVPAWITLYCVPATGRLYSFYWWNLHGVPLRDAGDVFLRYSDDDGVTWSERQPLGVPPSAMDDPQGDIHGWNFGQPRLLAAGGHVLFTYTKMRRSSLFPVGYALGGDDRWRKLDSRAQDVSPGKLIGGGSANHWETEVFLCECSNILTEEDPRKLTFRWLPEGPEDLWVPYPGTQRHFGQEGTLVSLADERMLCVLRTRQGHPYYSVSEDGGRTWRPPEVLRYSPGGEPLWQPCAPCPIHRLSDGRLVLLFHNTAPSGSGWYPRDPLWATVGRETMGTRDNAGHVFGAPKVLVYNDRVPGGPFNDTEICYPQLYEIAGDPYVVYANKTSEIRINRVAPELLDDSGLPR